MNYSFEKAITNEHGIAIYATALQAVNWKLAQIVSNHPQTKMPTTTVTSPDDLRDPMQFPETAFSQPDPVQFDLTVNGLIASAVLLNNIVGYKDYDPTTGRETTPYAYIADRIQTPYKAIQRQYEWRADMACKMAQEQAALIGIKDSSEIGNKAKERSKATNKERIAYALAEIDSIAVYSLKDEDTRKLQEMLIDLDGKLFNGLLITSNLANASMENARKRLSAGQYVNVDIELALFAKATVRDDQPD